MVKETVQGYLICVPKIEAEIDENHLSDLFSQNLRPLKIEIHNQRAILTYPSLNEALLARKQYDKRFSISQNSHPTRVILWPADLDAFTDVMFLRCPNFQQLAFAPFPELAHLQSHIGLSEAPIQMGTQLLIIRIPSFVSEFDLIKAFDGVQIGGIHVEIQKSNGRPLVAYYKKGTVSGKAIVTLNSTQAVQAVFNTYKSCAHPLGRNDAKNSVIWKKQKFAIHHWPLSLDQISQRKKLPTSQPVVKCSQRPLSHNLQAQMDRMTIGTPASKASSVHQIALTKSIFDRDLLSFYEKTRQTDEVYQKKLKVLRLITAALKTTFAPFSVDLYPFGSTVNGCGAKDADLDVYAVINNGTKDLIDHTVMKIKRSLESSLLADHLEEIEPRPKARVPIVTMRLSNHFNNLEIDINTSSSQGVYQSYLIKQYTLMDHRVGILALLVKKWAEANEVSGASDGFLNSFAYALLVINYFRKAVSRPIWNLQAVSPKEFDGSRELSQLEFDAMSSAVAAHNIRFGPICEIVNRTPVGGLLINFFKYYSTFAWDKEKVSIRGDESPVMRGTGNKDLIFIEDPFTTENVATAVKKQSDLETLKRKIERTYQNLKDEPTLDKFLKKA